MHERSLIRMLLDQVRVICREREIERIESIRIGVGDFSGVEADLLRSAFDELVFEVFDNPVQLEVKRIPLRASCRDCGDTFVVSEFKFVCPRCSSPQVRIVSGEELQLISLEVRDDVAHKPPEEGLVPLNGGNRT